MCRLAMPLAVLAGACVSAAAQPYQIHSAYREVEADYVDYDNNDLPYRNNISIATNHHGLWNDSAGYDARAYQRSVVGPHWIGASMYAYGDDVVVGDYWYQLFASSRLEVEFTVLALDLVEEFYVYGSEGQFVLERLSPDPAVVVSLAGPPSSSWDLVLTPGRYRLEASVLGMHYRDGESISFGIPTPGTLAFIACAAMLGVRRSRRA